MTWVGKWIDTMLSLEGGQKVSAECHVRFGVPSLRDLDFILKAHRNH